MRGNRLGLDVRSWRGTARGEVAKLPASVLGPGGEPAIGDDCVDPPGLDGASPPGVSGETSTLEVGTLPGTGTALEGALDDTTRD